MNKGYRINIKNPACAILTSDTKEGTEYGPVLSLGESQTIVVTPSVASGALYGDGAQQDAESRLTGMTVALDTTKVPMEVKAEIYKLQEKDGVLMEEAGGSAEYIAFGYETEQTDGNSEYVWLLKGKPRPMNDTRQQSDTQIKYSTDKMEIDFVRRKSDNMLRYFAEVGTLGFTAEQASAWFNEGPSTPVAKVKVETPEDEVTEEEPTEGTEGETTEGTE